MVDLSTEAYDEYCWWIFTKRPGTQPMDYADWAAVSTGKFVPYQPPPPRHNRPLNFRGQSL